VVQLSGAAKQAEVKREGEEQVKRPASAPSNAARRKALLIGINYSDAHAQLKGCINDAWNINCLLRHSLKFQEDQVRLLIDGENGLPPKEARGPTLANITAGLQWLVRGAQPGDCLFLLFCGFGAQHPQSPGSDVQEAYLVPSDFAADVPPELLAVVPEETAPPATRPRSQQADSKGYRLLPLMELNRLAAQLPAGSKLTMILDCSYPLVPNLGPANNLAPTFPKVPRGRVDYGKLHDFVSRPRFRSTAGELQEALLQRTTELRQHFMGVGQTPVLLLSKAASADDAVV